MVDPTTGNTIAPLPNTQKIVNADGTPTLYFIRWAQERSTDISGGLTVAGLNTILAGIKVLAGAGLTGGGPISANVTIAMPVIAPPVAGVYTSANITVDQYGRVVVAASGSGGGGGSYAKIQKITAVGTETTLTFTAIPGTYSDLILSISGPGRGAGGVQYFFRANGDTAAHYSFYRWNHYGSSSTINANWMDLVSMADASDGEITIAGYASTTANKLFKANSAFGTTSDSFPQVASGEWYSTAAITSLNIFMSDGGVFPANSVFTLYGRG